MVKPAAAEECHVQNVVSGLMDRLLVSTAIEESWGESEPVVFLGEWCRLFSRRQRWKGVDAEVATYHWSDRKKVESDRVYLWGLHERLLLDLSHELNKIHGVDHGLRYWRILVGPWLGYFTQTLFDRWEQIFLAIDSFEVSETIVLEGLPEARCGVDMADYLNLGNSQQWNHYLSAEILRGISGIRCRLHVTRGADLPTLPEEEDSTISGAHRLALQASRVLSRFSRATDVFVTNAGFRSLRSEVELQMRLGQVPLLIQGQPLDPCSFDPVRRDWVLDTETAGQTGFEDCLRSLVARFIPISYLEGYHSLVEQSESTDWPKRPRVIFTAASHFYDDLFKAWSAQRVEKGSRLVIGQHGGHVGVGWSFNHDHQVAIADQVLSWGWEDSAEPKVRPVGMMKDPRLDRDHRHGGSRAVIVMGNEVTQVNTLASSALSSQFLDYMGDQRCFMESLDQTVRSALLVRLSRYDSDWSFGERLMDHLPDIELDYGVQPISELLQQARLYITTNNGTTFLESIFHDIPTVMFWDTDLWGLTEVATPVFEQLSAAGVFFDNPIEAARHVSEVWGDVDSWWNAPEVRQAVEAFAFQFCRQTPNILSEVRRVLVEIGEVR